VKLAKGIFTEQSVVLKENDEKTKLLGIYGMPEKCEGFSADGSGYVQPSPVRL
jgi:hypothetical protein